MKETIILEIRAGEGGSDAKLLVKDTLNIYLKSARNQFFEYKIYEEREGFASI
jgi:protein subunit release factor A